MYKRLSKLFVELALTMILFQSLCIGPSWAMPANPLYGGSACRLGRNISSDAPPRVLPPRSIDERWFGVIEREATALKRIFGVSAVLVFVKEEGRPNAFADEAPLEVLRRFKIRDESARDGMVFLGVDLLEKEIHSYHRTGFSIPSIIAHEYAHILQFKYGLPFGDTKRYELHADFVAGWYTAHRSRFVPQNLYESMASFYQQGDYEFNDPDHHGTPRERLAAFKAGINLNFCCNISSSKVAYERGVKYLQ